MTDLQSEMARVKSRVDNLILDRLLPSSSSIPEVDLLYRMMRDYPSRPAKGMRPFLCVKTCQAAGGSEDRALLTAACIELFQHWILIHDDIEDASELRRGAPSLHRKYGEALALNAGDALHARMWGSLLLNEPTLGSSVTHRILSEFSRMVNETTEGQHMELGWVSGKRWDLTEEDYRTMCTKKTSWYTVASPCRLGAIVAGADDGVLDSLMDFGIKLGVAFQIQDDTLNLVGDEKKYGKATMDDIFEGKRTLILLHLISQAKPDDKKKLIAIMNKPREQKTSTDVSFVLSLMKDSGAVDYARRQAIELMNQALVTLKSIRWEGDPGAVSLLESFCRFAVEREW